MASDTSCSYNLSFICVSLCLCIHLCSGVTLDNSNGKPQTGYDSDHPTVISSLSLQDVVQNDTFHMSQGPAPSSVPSPSPAPASVASTSEDRIPSPVPAPVRTPMPAPSSRFEQSSNAAFRKRGKILGIVLISFAGILQALIALFLLSKRQQMLKHMHGFQERRDPSHNWSDA